MKSKIKLPTVDGFDVIAELNKLAKQAKDLSKCKELYDDRGDDSGKYENEAYLNKHGK